MENIHKLPLRSELAGGIEAAIQGLPNAIGPILLLLGIFGPQAIAPGAWAALVTATLVPAVSLLLMGQSTIHRGARTASLAAYAALVLQLCNAMKNPLDSGLALTVEQLSAGLAAGSVMFLFASFLVLLSGLLKLGNMFKMIPAPVTAGINNGTALLMVSLAVKQITHSSWLAALTAAGMVASHLLWPRLQQRIDALRVIPAALVAPLVGLSLSLALEPAFHPVTAVGANGWVWMSVRLWPVIQQQAFGHLLIVGLPGAVTLALVMILETFNASSVMETRFGLRINPNRELLSLGGSNIVSALLGGVPSTGNSIRSVANWTAGGRGLLAAVTSIGLTGVLLVAFGNWLMVLPAGIVAGVFLMQAILMVDRLSLLRIADFAKTRCRKRKSTADTGFWITLSISVVGFFGTLIWACFMGIGLSCLVVLRRVSSSLTSQWAYLNHYRSRRVRSPVDTSNLEHDVHSVGILRLTGHLFFGNSTRLTQLADELHLNATSVVIDVSQVQDVDPSGLGALVWLIRALVGKKLNVVVSGLKQTNSVELGQTLEVISGVKICVDLDRGLELCEDWVLKPTLRSTAARSVLLENNNLLQELSAGEITTVLMLGERCEVAQGAALFRRYSQADGVWLLEQGMVSVLSGEGEDSSRLATFGPGQFVGEMGFIDGKTRSATARADTHVRALLLDSGAISALMEQQPALALKLTRNIARELSHRVRNSSALSVNEPVEDASGWANSSLSILSRY